LSGGLWIGILVGGARYTVKDRKMRDCVPEELEISLGSRFGPERLALAGLMVGG